MSINRTIVSGRLTAEPETRYTAKGTPVLSFSVCFDSRVLNQDGTYTDKPNYIDCALFGKRAEAITQYISKGSHVTCDGHLSFSEYEKSGQRHTKLQLVVDDIDFSGNQKKE